MEMVTCGILASARIWTLELLFCNVVTRQSSREFSKLVHNHFLLLSFCLFAWFLAILYCLLLTSPLLNAKITAKLFWVRVVHLCSCALDCGICIGDLQIKGVCQYCPEFYLIVNTEYIWPLKDWSHLTGAVDVCAHCVRLCVYWLLVQKQS